MSIFQQFWCARLGIHQPSPRTLRGVQRPTLSVGNAARASQWAIRRLTASRRSLPDFLIVGAQRAGTTSLYRWLAAHEGVHPAFRKEVHYFDLHFSKGLSWYRANFPLQEAPGITGEATPYLLFHPLAPGRIAEQVPEAKLIVVLRHPVERAISHFSYMRALGIEPLTLPEAIAAEPRRLRGTEEQVSEGGKSPAHQHFSYVAKGMYASQLRRWFEVFGAQSLLLVESGELFRSERARRSVLVHLGLAPAGVPFPTTHGAARNFTPADDLDAVRQTLADLYREPNTELFTLIGRTLWADEPAQPDSAP